MELVKEDNYYVPKKYLYYSDTGKKRIPDCCDHACAFPPHYHFDDESGKWCLRFASADFGGYDVTVLCFYFDSESDLLDFLKEKK